MEPDAAHNSPWMTSEAVFGIPFPHGIAIQFTIPRPLPQETLPSWIVPAGVTLFIAGVAFIPLRAESFGGLGSPPTLATQRPASSQRACSRSRGIPSTWAQLASRPVLLSQSDCPGLSSSFCPVSLPATICSLRPSPLRSPALRRAVRSAVRRKCRFGLYPLQGTRPWRAAPRRCGEGRRVRTGARKGEAGDLRPTRPSAAKSV